MIEFQCKINFTDDDLTELVKRLSPFTLFNVLKIVEKELHDRGWAIEGYYYHADDDKIPHK